MTKKMTKEVKRKSFFFKKAITRVYNLAGYETLCIRYRWNLGGRLMCPL